ncbi:MAG TPA: DUF1109 domain-containing protein [Candidatus Binataceae bacterium]|nr:DUF1109 domain-containing protein [Candidatus Binataceae bacterium]
MEIRQAREQERQALIERLVRDLKPVRPLWPVNTRLAMWLLMNAALLILAVTFGARPDLQEKIHSLRFLTEVIAFGGAGTVAAILALRAAIPGREPTRGELQFAVAIAAVAILFVFSEPMALDVRMDGFIHEGLRCAFCTCVVAVIPWLAMLWAVRRGAPTRLTTAGALIGAAAFFFSLVITRLGCPIDDRIHFLTWHVIPALAGISLSVLAGIAWLRRKTFIG